MSMKLCVDSQEPLFVSPKWEAWTGWLSEPRDTESCLFSQHVSGHQEQLQRVPAGQGAGHSPWAALEATQSLCDSG